MVKLMNIFNTNESVYNFFLVNQEMVLESAKAANQFFHSPQGCVKCMHCAGSKGAYLK